MTERELITAALNLQGSARLAYLEHACGSDRALRVRVDRMLSEQDRPDGVPDATASMTAEAMPGQPSADDPDATGGHDCRTKTNPVSA